MKYMLVREEVKTIQRIMAFLKCRQIPLHSLPNATNPVPFPGFYQWQCDIHIQGAGKWSWTERKELLRFYMEEKGTWRWQAFLPLISLFCQIPVLFSLSSGFSGSGSGSSLFSPPPQAELHFTAAAHNPFISIIFHHSLNRLFLPTFFFIV